MMKRKMDYTDLARQTEKWMKDIGATWIEKTEISGEIPKFVSVQEWAEYFDFPLDENTGEVTQFTQNAWQHTKLEMILLSIPISVKAFKGHYLGKEGDQASNIFENVSQSLARLQRSMIQLEAIVEAGDYETCRKMFKGKIVPDQLHKLLKETPGVVPEKYNGVPSDPLVKLLKKNNEK
jgi:hypothetical protein